MFREPDFDKSTSELNLVPTILLAKNFAIIQGLEILINLLPLVVSNNDAKYFLKLYYRLHKIATEIYTPIKNYEEKHYDSLAKNIQRSYIYRSLSHFIKLHMQVEKSKNKFLALSKDRKSKDLGNNKFAIEKIDIITLSGESISLHERPVISIESTMLDAMTRSWNEIRITSTKV